MLELLHNDYIYKAIQTLIMCGVIYLLTRLSLSLTRKATGRNSETPFIIKYIALAFFGLSMAMIWLEGITPLFTALTIVAAALTIVSKEFILNIIGSFVIMWRELFAVGDRVEIKNFYGDVIDKGVLYFTILEVGSGNSTRHSTGRLVKIPNSLVITEPVANSTRGAGYVWNEISFKLTGASDRNGGKQLLLDTVNEYFTLQNVNFDQIKRSFEKKRIYFKELTPKVYTAVDQADIVLTLRYLCRSRLIRESEDFITVRFLDNLDKMNLTLAEK